jgi:hypothetical protein
MHGIGGKEDVRLITQEIPDLEELSKSDKPQVEHATLPDPPVSEFREGT